jgi:hypothetical protein
MTIEIQTEIGYHQARDLEQIHSRLTAHGWHTPAWTLLLIETAHTNDVNRIVQATKKYLFGYSPVRPIPAITDQGSKELCSMLGCPNIALDQGKGPSVCKDHDPGR